MKHSGRLYCALLLVVAWGVAGCSSQGPPPMPAIGGADGGAAPKPYGAGSSWTADGLGPQDLLYVANANGLVNIYRYWQRNLVGVLTNFTQPMGECADSHRNVYITDYGAKTIVEYAHGGSTAIRTINDGPNHPYTCAVSPSNGDLAIANYSSDYTYYGGYLGNVTIYKHAEGKPKVYGGKDGGFNAIGYDDSGNLLASDLRTYYWSDYSANFYYLPNHGTQFLQMKLPWRGTSSYGFPSVQSINYDGQYWDVTAENSINQYEIGVKATLIGSMELSGASGRVGQVALYRRKRKEPATQAVAGGPSATAVEYWHYPVTGGPYASITSEIDDPYGIAISIRTANP